MKKDNTALVQKGNRLVEEIKNVVEELRTSTEGRQSEVFSNADNQLDGSSETDKALAQLQKVLADAEAANETKKTTIRTTVDFKTSTHNQIVAHLKNHNHYRKIAPWLIYLAERELGLRN